MKFEFHPEALAEYEQAARYYAGCQEGLDLRFMASVEAAVRQVAAAPQGLAVDRAARAAVPDQGVPLRDPLHH